jgi:nucleotide-binding universal stress UspA family protein
MAILVATDFSPCSRTAVRLASALARRRGASLLIVHAIAPPTLAFPQVPIGASPRESERSMAAEVAIARIASEIGDAGIAVQTRVVLGLPAQVVLEVTRGGEVDLVVVGSHGRRGAAHLFVGSVAEKVVAASPCPVLVTREDVLATRPWDGREELRLVGVVDGSTATQTTLSWMKTFATAPASDLSLVRVYAPADEALRYGLEEVDAESSRMAQLLPLLQRDLERDARALMGRPPTRARFRAAARGQGEIVAEEAQGLGANALVIGVPQRSVRRSHLVTPESVLRHATVPVFCIPQAPTLLQREIAPVRSVLVASDLSDASRAAILPAYGLLRAAGGHVELLAVHVAGSEGLLDDARAPPLDAGARKVLESKLGALIPSEVASYGIKTSVSVVEGRSAAEAILAAAERLGVDIVAIGSHGRSGFGRLALGSVAEEVARRSRRPVLVVRARPGHA